jgi:hypothetical protein
VSARSSVAPATALLLAAGLLGAGCSDDGRNVRAYRACSSTATGDATVRVEVADHRMTLEPATVPAGLVILLARNVGSDDDTLVVRDPRGSVLGRLALPDQQVCAEAFRVGPGRYVLTSDRATASLTVS